ncbi:MAG: hypothetical protein LQ339_005935 [Xanthoria mediterranea]|nr:MAG: hypothetical protein LQ339_005935 [Xanthoria mediterranea]
MEPRQDKSSKTELPFQQLLNHNDTRVIENPLRRVAEEHVVEWIKNFHGDNGLHCGIDVATLIRGARLARQEEIFRTKEIAEGTLTEVEKRALAKEKVTTIWNETRELKIILLICCLGSVLQGAIVGANTTWPRALGLDLEQHGPRQTNGKDIWKFSATNAIVYFAASTVGAFLCDPLTEIVTGRRAAIFVAALFTFVASIGEAFAHDWRALLAWRFFLGIGMGAKSSVIPIYESEVSPARLRGQVLTSWQTGTALGIAISGAIALIVPGSWRYQLSSSLIPAFALLLLVFVGSESPRWLIKKQRYDKAYIVLTRLRGSPLLAARDFVLIFAQLQVEATLFMRTNQDIIQIENRIPHVDPQMYRQLTGLSCYARRITQLFVIPRARRATLASFLVMTAQQMSGINVFAFLASTLFKSNDKNSTPETSPEKASLWLYFVFGVVNFLSSIIAYFFIDTKGRRWLLMLSLALMLPFLIGTAFSFKAAEDTSRQRGLTATFLVLYTMAYSPGAGVVPFLYSSEIFPQILREVGMAWASAVSWMGAGILDLCVPALIRELTPTGLLCLFAGTDALALCLVWLFVPGTERKQATMEEMNYVFGVATHRHMNYQTKEVAP